MSVHDRLREAGITPTIDATRAYRLGFGDALEDAAVENAELRVEADGSAGRVAWLEQILAEVSLTVRRGLYR